MVAFDRFLARLQVSYPNQWYLKGGYALQLRLGNKARTTADIDILMFSQQNIQYGILTKAVKTDLEDWFTFEMEQPRSNPNDENGDLRVNLSSFLDGRLYEKFHLDIGVNDLIMDQYELISNPDYLSFAEIEPIQFRCYSIAQHFSEKLHAYTRVYHNGISSRVKDMVDLFLIAQMEEIDSLSFRNACQRTFEHRATHLIPEKLPSLPIEWQKPFKKMAGDVGIEFTQDETFQKLELFINPMLKNTDNWLWNPQLWTWEVNKISQL
jgi:predicted nucleotidyltransferase component of viral defense system